MNLRRALSRSHQTLPFCLINLPQQFLQQLLQLQRLLCITRRCTLNAILEWLRLVTRQRYLRTALKCVRWSGDGRGEGGGCRIIEVVELR